MTLVLSLIKKLEINFQELQIILKTRDVLSLVYFFSNKKKILKNENKVFQFNLRNMNEIFICSHNLTE